ncbi:hypothetical protein HOG21_06160 [bacterium]|nr:hypothetical protein [bacterium]
MIFILYLFHTCKLTHLTTNLSGQVQIFLIIVFFQSYTISSKDLIIVHILYTSICVGIIKLSLIVFSNSKKVLLSDEYFHVNQ